MTTQTISFAITRCISELRKAFSMIDWLIRRIRKRIAGLDRAETVGNAAIREVCHLARVPEAAQYFIDSGLTCRAVMDLLLGRSQSGPH
jgi:hypothetical protein